MSNKLQIGLHTNLSSIIPECEDFSVASDNGQNIDFALCHFDPGNDSIKDCCEQAESCVKKFKELNLDVIANFEQQNFKYDVTSEDGFDWGSHSEGVHRLTVPKKYIDSLNSQENCLGIMYDEFEHTIINRNLSISVASKFKKDIPVFPTTGNSHYLHQSALLDEQLKEYADTLKSDGAATVSGEHVFPVLFHRFAKAGIIPNFKSQKESYSNIQFAIAAGAAIEYNTPLWNCVDLWCRMVYPGHSPMEFYNNLKFSFICGVDRMYVEEFGALVTDGKLNEYGVLFNEFSKEYKNKERSYTFRDYEPEIGIIRCDDSFWGQGVEPLIWRNMLLGNPKIHIKKESREWIQAFNIITHGETGNGGLSYDRVSSALIKKHRSFASMNGAVVFDDNASKDNLKTLKLCFLCGIDISLDTLAAVEELVRENGLIVVTTKKYLPDRFLCKGAYCEYKDGKGLWICVDSFKNSQIKNRLKPYLGKKGEMSYRFAGKKYTYKINENAEEFQEI